MERELEITQEELDTLITGIHERLSFVSTQFGASHIMSNGKTARETCEAYRIVRDDLSSIIF